MIIRTVGGKLPSTTDLYTMQGDSPQHHKGLHPSQIYEQPLYFLFVFLVK